MTKIVAIPKSIICERIRVVKTRRPEVEAEKFWNEVTRGRVAKRLLNSKYIKVELRSGLILVLKRKGNNCDGTIDISVSTKKVRRATKLKDQRIRFVKAEERKKEEGI